MELEGYVKSIISVLVFSAFVEMLMPKENYRKYISIVLGFIIMLVMISPIMRFFGKGSASDIIRKYDFKLQSAADSLGSSFNISKGYGSGLVEDIYRNDISESIKESLDSEGINANVSAVEIDNDPSSESYGAIKSVEINMSASEQESSVYVPKVEVKIGNYFDYETEENEESKEEKEVYSILSKNYGVGKENVYIQKR
ncbi:MAG: stage III sporulation protein AF [Lachnospiraceae bacterium]|nr:stage III sporulation protein AF [Lachnospiraceae bacterium]